MKGKGEKSRRVGGKRVRNKASVDDVLDEIQIPGPVTRNLLQVVGEMQQLPYGEWLRYFLASITDEVVDYLNRVEHPYLHLLLLAKFEEEAEESGKELAIDRDVCEKYLQFLLGVEELRRKGAAAVDSYPADVFEVCALRVEFESGEYRERRFKSFGRVGFGGWGNADYALGGRGAAMRSG